MQAVRKGGTFVQIGTVVAPVTFPLNLVMLKEMDLRGSFRYAHDYPAAVTLLSSIPVRDVITTTYDFERTVEAFQATDSPDNIKIHTRLA